MHIDTKIEAILFFKGEPVSHKTLAKLLNTQLSEIKEALGTLEKKLSGRGIQLLQKDTVVELRAAPEVSDIIVSMRKEELSRDISKAGVETLAIILYQSPVTRADVDHIRGVNSTFIIRNLLIRGLIEKVSNPQRKHSVVYKPTLELLSYLGITKVEELPEFDTVKHDIDMHYKEHELNEDRTDE